jgi:arylsulfatase A-like enzyme
MFMLKQVQRFISVVGGMAFTVSAADRPNIVFILTDDQRWDSLGCYGNPVIQTPNIDRLAENGTLFTSSFVTTSICMVSRASILTGQYARRHGIHDFFATFSSSQMEKTYPVLLRESGYYTGFIGKWGIGNTVEATNLGAEYFDYWAGVSHQGNYWHERTCNHVLHDGIHDKTNNVCDCPPQQRGNRTVSGPDVRFGKGSIKDPVHYTTEVLPGKFRGFLASRDSHKPFCLSISFKEPHNPYDYHPKFETLYKNTPMPIQLNATLEAAENMGYARRSLSADNGLEYVKNQEVNGKFQDTIRQYYRLVTAADEAVGHLLQALEDAGLSHNTVIIYTADNGYMLGEHGLHGKWLPYEESIRVPTIFYDPRSSKKQRSPETVLNIDMAPTMLDLAGVEIPATVQGKSMLPLMKNPQPQEPFRTEWFYEHHHGSPRIQPTEAVISGEWKYIKYLNYEDAGSEELYQLSSDPYELTELSGNPEFNDVLRRLRGRMATYRETLK